MANRTKLSAFAAKFSIDLRPSWPPAALGR
jgi:hypothetical protein